MKEHDGSAGRSSFTRRVLVTTGILVAAVAFLALIWASGQVLLVVFTGILIAVALDGTARLISDHSPLPRWLALGLVVLLLLGGLVGGGMLIGPAIAKQFDDLFKKLAEGWSSLRAWMQGSVWLRGYLPRLDQLAKALPSGWEAFGKVRVWATSALGVVTQVIVIIFIGLYGAITPHRYVDPALRLVPPGKRARAGEVVSMTGTALRRWLAGRFVSMLVVGILTAVGLWLLGIPVAVGLAILAGLLSFIPNIGPILSAIPAISIGLIEGPMMALWVTLLYVGVQTVESYFITPLIELRAVSLPPAFLISVQLLMGVLFGILGLSVATPLAVVAVVLVQLLYLQDLLREHVVVLGNHESS